MARKLKTLVTVEVWTDLDADPAQLVMDALDPDASGLWDVGLHHASDGEVVEVED